MDVNDCYEDDLEAAALVQGWIVCGKRVGRTWLRWLMVSALDHHRGGTGETDWISIYSVVPGDDPREKLRWRHYRNVPGFLRPDHQPRLVTSHRGPAEFDRTDAPILALIRQPFDQVASHFHHYVRKSDPLGDPRDVTPDEFALAPDLGIDYYLRIYVGWAEAVASGRAAAIGYEQLKADPATTLLRVFDHFGVPMSRESANRAAEYCTFDRMLRAERQELDLINDTPKVRLYWDSDPNVRRTRQGLVGAGAALFAPATLAAMEQRLAQETPELTALIRECCGWSP